MHVGVIGSGISGLASAWLLSPIHHVDVFEAGDHLGGHANTVDIRVDGQDLAVDTGFMVFNDRTYPNLLGMLGNLGLSSKRSRMSFSVQCGDEGLEWSSRRLVGVFSQPESLVRGGVWRMLYDIARLSATADRLLADGSLADLTLGELLEREGYKGSFVDWYLVPMASSIWSTPPGKVLDYPAESFIRFCDNHGLLHVLSKPSWQTIAGGARGYVEQLARGVSGDLQLGVAAVRVERTADGPTVTFSDGTTRRFDTLVIGTHSDEALGLLADPSPAEREVLGAIGYQPNTVVLHTDDTFLPARRLARASWNYYAAECTLDATDLSVTYYLNVLQQLPVKTPVLITVNPVRAPREDRVLRTFSYSHPVFGRDALEAQRRIPEIQGERDTWYCGAWQRYGFHEDGLLSAVNLVERFGVLPPWGPSREPSPGRTLVEPALGDVPVRESIPGLAEA